MTNISEFTPKPHFIARRRVATNKVMRERHGNKYASCRLLDEQVLEIRRRYKTGAVTLKSLGEEYGVSHVIICLICQGKRYKHVPMP